MFNVCRSGSPGLTCASLCAVQYAEFLSTALAPAEYAALLPPVAQLVNNYGIDAEVVFQVCRRAAWCFGTGYYVSALHIRKTA